MTLTRSRQMVELKIDSSGGADLFKVLRMPSYPKLGEDRPGDSTCSIIFRCPTKSHGMVVVLDMSRIDICPRSDKVLKVGRRFDLVYKVIFVHVNVYASVHACVHGCAYICIYVDVDAFVYVGACVFAYVYTSTSVAIWA